MADIVPIDIKTIALGHGGYLFHMSRSRSYQFRTACVRKKDEARK